MAPDANGAAAAVQAACRNIELMLGSSPAYRKVEDGLYCIKQGSTLVMISVHPWGKRAVVRLAAQLVKGVSMEVPLALRSPRHPLGRLVGDCLVLQASGSGRSRTRRIAFDEEYGHHVGGAHHFALLNHPAVYDKLRVWLASSNSRPLLGPGSPSADS